MSSWETDLSVYMVVANSIHDGSYASILQICAVHGVKQHVYMGDTCLCGRISKSIHIDT